MPGPYCLRPYEGQRHQVATTGADEEPGKYLITCRSPFGQPSVRTSWSRTVAGPASGKAGVQPSGAPAALSTEHELAEAVVSAVE